MSVSGFDQDYVVQPGARPLYARPLGNIAAAMIGVIALLILGVALVVVGNRPVVEAQTDSATPEAAGGASVPESVAVVKQYAAFDLTSPEFAKEKKAVSTRQLDGGIREDNLTLGQFSSGEPYLRLDLRQPNGEKRANPDFFLDLTRHAAQAGLSVAKIGQPSPLSTRFGSFEVADIRLSQTSSQGAPTERACLAMRLAGAKLPVEIAGISCGDPRSRLTGARSAAFWIGSTICRTARTRRWTCISWRRNRSAAKVAAAARCRQARRNPAGSTPILAFRPSRMRRRRQSIRRKPIEAKNTVSRQ